MSIYPFKNRESLDGKEQGFTLFEIIATLVLISVVAVSIVSRAGNNTDLIAAAEILKGHLRYAQSRAMSLDQNWGIFFVGNTYTLQQNGVASGVLPGESGNTVNLSGGITITAVPAPNPIVFSSNWGIPGAPTAVTLADGPNSETITITSETGFIP